MSTLESFGWSRFFNEQNNKNTDLNTGRVVSIQGFIYHLITNAGELTGELSGKLLYGSDQELIPRVGDWVSYNDYDTLAYIVDVLPRMNALYRRNPGKTTERQILAANMDYALIVQGLDRDFNLMRLDRYVVQVQACGIKPLIILNKEDLIENPEEYRLRVERFRKDVPVYFCSTLKQTGIETIYKALKPGMTHVLIGSSGVGKSSLLNALKDDDHLKTGDLSTSTQKGKHTTTTRDLFMLPNGSLVIDTPGMREFGMALEEDVATSGLFPAIEQLAKNCRYTDCSHLTEEGCAVIDAVQKGTLDGGIYQSYTRLMKEQQHFQIRIEDKKRLGKQFGKMSREAKAYRMKYKY